jgi:tetrahydrodipicolinate N-succinyltransferase
MPESDVKPWWQSRAIIGGAVSIGAVVAGLFGFNVDPDTQAVIVDQGVAIGAAVATVVGGVMAIWGRIKATKAIK